MAELISELELNRLPPIAQRAFLARQVRRVQPRFAAHWKDLPHGFDEAIDSAIAFVENVEIDRGDDSILRSHQERLEHILGAFKMAFGMRPSPAKTVVHAVGSALDAVAADPGYLKYYYALTDCRVACSEWDYCRNDFRADFEGLIERLSKPRARIDCLTPAAFGPLWPNGAPYGWP